MTPGRQRITNRFVVEILVRHKHALVRAQEKKEQAQDDINGIIEDFVRKTGRQVSRMAIEEVNGQFNLKLEVS